MGKCVLDSVFLSIKFCETGGICLEPITPNLPGTSHTYFRNLVNSIKCCYYCYCLVHLCQNTLLRNFGMMWCCGNGYTALCLYQNTEMYTIKSKLVCKFLKIKPDVREIQDGIQTVINECNCVTNESPNHTKMSEEERSWFKELCKFVFWFDTVRLKMKMNCTLAGKFISHKIRG